MVNGITKKNKIEKGNKMRKKGGSTIQRKMETTIIAKKGKQGMWSGIGKAKFVS